MQKTTNGLLKLWLMPLIVALMSLAGLTAAILGTGFWHVFSWIALAYPLFIVLKYGRKFFS